MKKNSIIIVTLIALITLLGLSACSNAENKNSENAEGTVSKQQESKSFYFYQDAKNNSRIYYVVSSSKDTSFGKDTVIKDVIYVDHGEYTHYGISGIDIPKHTLGELRKLSDKEILKLAKEWNEEANNIWSDGLKKKSKDIINGTPWTFPDQMVEVAKKNITFASEFKYEEPKPKKLEVFYETDSSGNNLEEEFIRLPNYGSQVKAVTATSLTQENKQLMADQVHYYAVGSGMDNVMSVSLSPSKATTVVYDKTYAIGNFGKNRVLATKGKSLLELDQITEEGFLEYSESDTQYKSV
ncbi:hypothetical protein [Carnobacterium maltaromaticum]|uniref:hypothetical protein n=1 Tax=Carnobacterium maltaromaticum TaxID=2751 RepID=UPI0010728472|nr:hypothetical protein [Carnobacterium maltaromaticum]TFJ72138.1 hypothetical protein CKN94_13180 [Carnobacterium maltaromaticum]TFJ77051.1 hypothetical protein CKN97_13170 [Carnobacterium maltaromaticum]